MLRLILGVLALVLVPAAARAAPGDVAIIVANKSYRGGIPPVEFADRDADEFQKAALARDVLNIGATGLKRFNDMTGREAEGWFQADGAPGEELIAFIRRATLGRRDATITFYYSGHGIATRSEARGQDELHLILHDTSTKAVARTGLSIEAVKLALAKVVPPQGRVVILVDACFSGVGRDGTQLWDGARMIGDTAAAVKTKARDRVVMLTAAAGNEPAWSDFKRKHGAFTDALLDGLYGRAAGADGRITAEGLLAFIARRANERLVKQGRSQTPTLIGEGATPIALLTPPLPERVPGTRRHVTLRCAIVGASRDPAEIKGFLEGECAEECPCQDGLVRKLAAVEGEARACASEAKMLEGLAARGAAARVQIMALRDAATCAAVRERVAAVLASLDVDAQAERKQAEQEAAEQEARERAAAAQRKAVQCATDRKLYEGVRQADKGRLRDVVATLQCPEVLAEARAWACRIEGTELKRLVARGAAAKAALEALAKEAECETVRAEAAKVLVAVVQDEARAQAEAKRRASEAEAEAKRMAEEKARVRAEQEARARGKARTNAPTSAKESNPRRKLAATDPQGAAPKPERPVTSGSFDGNWTIVRQGQSCDNRRWTFRLSIANGVISGRVSSGEIRGSISVSGAFRFTHPSSFETLVHYSGTLRGSGGGGRFHVTRGTCLGVIAATRG